MSAWRFLHILIGMLILTGCLSFTLYAEGLIEEAPSETGISKSDVGMWTESDVVHIEGSARNASGSDAVREIAKEGKTDLRADDELAGIVSGMLEEMTLEEKVLQMFVISPEALTGVSGVTLAGETTREAIHHTPVGGLLYMESNLQSAEQITQMLSNTQQYSMERISLPMFVCVDEEGGTVRRINGRGIIEGDAIPSMSTVSSVEEARRYGSQMGTYLSRLGFNVDFAPVADTMTNPDNQVVNDRSFGSDPYDVASKAAAVMEGLHESNVASAYKHFPGHGSTAEDTHAGSGISYQTMDDLLACDLVPFQMGVELGTEMIMVGHISLPEITGDYTPATLSYEIVTGILRDMMGYEGLIITDSLSMGAISQNYNSADAAVLAVQAGNDLLLCPADFSSARQGIIEAVQNGSISVERVNESAERILRLKVGSMMETFHMRELQ